MAAQKPWFIRRAGPMRYHIGPYAWQGWAISALFLAAMALTMRYLRRYLMEHLSVTSGLIVTIGLMVILLGLFIVIVVRFSASEKSLTDRDQKS